MTNFLCVCSARLRIDRDLLTLDNSITECGDTMAEERYSWRGENRTYTLRHLHIIMHSFILTTANSSITQAMVGYVTLPHLKGEGLCKVNSNGANVLGD